MCGLIAIGFYISAMILNSNAVQSGGSVWYPFAFIVLGTLCLIAQSISNSIRALAKAVEETKKQ